MALVSPLLLRPLFRGPAALLFFANTASVNELYKNAWSYVERLEKTSVAPLHTEAIGVHVGRKVESGWFCQDGCGIQPT